MYTRSCNYYLHSIYSHSKFISIERPHQRTINFHLFIPLDLSTPLQTQLFSYKGIPRFSTHQTTSELGETKNLVANILSRLSNLFHNSFSFVTFHLHHYIILPRRPGFGALRA